jgi:hypothetical protein
LKISNFTLHTSIAAALEIVTEEKISGLMGECESVNLDFDNYYQEIEGEEGLKISNFKLHPSNFL